MQTSPPAGAPASSNAADVAGNGPVAAVQRSRVGSLRVVQEGGQDDLRALEEAGADLLFPEALTSLEEYRIVKSATKVPILANMTEFGKTELFTKAELAEVGVSIIIYPVSLLRSAMGAATKTLMAIKRDGTQVSEVEQMQTRAELYELLDYQSYESFDQEVFKQSRS
jgi:methylisocitrate lyase